MILDHIPQSAGFFIIRGSRSHAFGFADGDLNMVDVFMIPDRLEDAVGKTYDHKILNRLFAKIMIDSENLRFVEDSARHFVDGFCRGQVAPNRFFDYDACLW